MTISPELLEAARKGARKAQYELYQQCYPVLMAVCLRYRRDESEASAALNDGFLKILQNLHRYSPEVPFVAWIRRIQINTLIDMFRREAKWRDQVLLSEKWSNSRMRLRLIGTRPTGSLMQNNWKTCCNACPRSAGKYSTFLRSTDIVMPK